MYSFSGNRGSFVNYFGIGCLLINCSRSCSGWRPDLSYIRLRISACLLVTGGGGLALLFCEVASSESAVLLGVDASEPFGAPPLPAPL